MKQNFVGGRMNLIFIVLLILGLTVLGRVYWFVAEGGEVYRNLSQKENLKWHEIPADRGDIYDCRMNLLASSVPLYELRVDFGAPTMVDTAFIRQVDALAAGLAEIFPEESRLSWRHRMNQARRKSKPDRYWLLRKGVSYGTMERVSQLPLLCNTSSLRGGLVSIAANRRVLPYGNLAARTVGFVQDDKARLGLEKGLDSLLSGQDGKVLKQRMGGGAWKPLGHQQQQEPIHGHSVVTSLDIRLQEIAHEALYGAMLQQGARSGCAILMENRTGQVRALANLTRDPKTGTVGEWDQVAYRIPVEPGSVFKLATLMAGLSDGYWSLQDSMAMGTYRFEGPSGMVLEDEHRYGPWMKVEDVFSKSSNVGIARLLRRHYGRRPQAFLDKLKAFGLMETTPLPLLNEPRPVFRNASSPEWNPVDLYATGIGYSMLITPLQLLTFYNAVVNEGIRVAPTLLEPGQVLGGDKGMPFKVELAAGRRILKVEHARAACRMMRKVAVDGTVREQMKGLTFGVGGKTGTARLRDARGKSSSDRHRAMFVGYFPDPNPRYTCLVMLEEPSNGLYYASQVAAPVFRDIAERTMAVKGYAGRKADPSALKDGVLARRRPIRSAEDLVGMDAAAAVWALESRGYRVTVRGTGRVKQCMGVLLSHAKPGQRVMLQLGV